MKKWLFIFPLLCLFGCSTEEEKTIPPIELGKWQFEYKGKWFSATVPGTIHTDLFAHNIIEDPFYGNNEQELQWIEDENWSYKNTFGVTQEQLQDKHIEINFKGLDT